jgi:hypothetical protein
MLLIRDTVRKMGYNKKWVTVRYSGKNTRKIINQFYGTGIVKVKNYNPQS